MDALFFLADAAHAHLNDGTFSVLRGGIDRIQSSAEGVIPLSAAGVARISGRPEEAGQHALRFRVVGADGRNILPENARPLTFPEAGGNHMVVVKFGIGFPGPGRFVFELIVDDRVLATWPVEVVRIVQGDA